ncbi:hypothetical protein DB30_05663 [Enhygromyxa salina]|uniref:Uncharacterized protein n=1 Tax=Enhygromyxa salina TaxID=215803 RepID=A0A0C2CWB1_9BACT|nr:hypothetical protein [Enhygromyxa salina]KIG15331.1 hypothetical protein DB30_05663 [Enhygromyxa salina]
MVMIPDIDAPIDELERAIDQRLREWVGPQIEHNRFRWSWSTPQGLLFAVLEVPAASEQQPDAEPTLELLRVLRDLGHSGTLAPDDAITVLAAGATLFHARICIGPDPGGSRRIALLLQGTLYLGDLQREEFDALVRELSDGLHSLSPRRRTTSAR